MIFFERYLLLQTFDTHWREHLAAIDYLRQGIHLRGYAQKHPKQEYKREAFELFGAMLDRIKNNVVGMMASVTLRTQEDVETIESNKQPTMQLIHNKSESLLDTESAAQITSHDSRIGRNDPCPCGSKKSINIVMAGCTNL